MKIDFTSLTFDSFLNVEFTNNPHIKRITEIALPFLSLYQPTRIASNVILCGAKTFTSLKQLKLDIENKQWKQASIKLILITCEISGVALSIFFPAHYIVAYSLRSILLHLYNYKNAVENKNYTEALASFYEMLISVTYIRNITTPSSVFALIAPLLQALKELKQSEFDFNHNKIPEALAKLLLAALRIFSAAPTARHIYRSNFGKNLTEEQFKDFVNKIYKEMETGKATTLDELLEREGYSDILEGFTLSGTYEDLQISNLFFKDCNLKEMELINCIVDNTKFLQCDMDTFRAVNSIFYNTIWLDSKVTNATFFNSLMYNCAIIHCDVDQTCFADSLLQNINILASRLFETNFFGSKAKESSIIDSDLTDTLLCNTKSEFHIEGGTPHTITRPVIGISWNHYVNQPYANFSVEALKENNAIVLKFHYQPPSVNPMDLDNEVLTILSNVEQLNPNPMVNIPTQILSQSQEGSQIQRIQSIADNVLKECDGLLLTGGPDIEPALYGKKIESYTYTESSFVRSIFELALIDSAIKQEIPLMATCRGAQIVNVRFGGTLEQYVDGHFAEFQFLQIPSGAKEAYKDMIKSIIGGDTILGLSMHHQAIDKIGDGLEVVLEFDNVPKALIGKDGNILLTQFHPEYYTYDDYPLLQTGRNFFLYFLDRVHQNMAFKPHPNTELLATP